MMIALFLVPAFSHKFVLEWFSFIENIKQSEKQKPTL